MSIAADTYKRTLKKAMIHARKQGDMLAVAALQPLFSRIESAEAVPLTAVKEVASAYNPEGVTETARRVLSIDTVADLLESERVELEAAAQTPDIPAEAAKELTQKATLVTEQVVRIRPATPDEFAKLGQVWRDAVTATHTFLTADDIDWYEAMVKKYLPALPELLVAVNAADTPLGFMAQENGEINMLFVDPKAHGRGIGSLLLATVFDRFPTVFLDVNEQNESGRTFYERKGFTVTGRSELDGEGRPFPLLHMHWEHDGV